MMQPAEPADGEGVPIVFVMRFNLGIAANFACAFFDFSPLHIDMEISPGIHALPRLASQGMGFTIMFHFRSVTFETISPAGAERISARAFSSFPPHGD
jgi:hypothetical protein